MKYKSELIKDIVDTRGHKKSSLHYESECVRAWIEETKGAYPKLCDYESEWLNYISILDDNGGSEEPEPPIGEFPYAALTDVTNATIDNVVPLAYKSAILKGRTLINLFDINSISNAANGSGNQNINDWVVFKNNGGASSQVFYYNTIRQDIEINKKYHAFLYVDENTIGDVTVAAAHAGFYLYPMSFTVSSQGVYKTTFIAKTTANDRRGVVNFRCITSSSNVGEFKFRILILKDEDVIGNEDFTYFEDMESVRMAGLTTSNEDGTKTNILTCNENVTLRGIGDVKDELDLLTGKLTQRIGEDGEVLAQEVVKTVDLSIQDQDGNTLRKIKPIEGTMHIHSDGTPLKPTFTLEIPVEAMTQNLASFIGEE